MGKTLFLSTVVCLFISSFTFADVTTTGDVQPGDPSTWTTSTKAYIGKTSDGTMTIDSGSDVISDRCYIGNDSGTNGSVSVEGIGSTLENHGMFVGYYGNGTLNITNGSIVNSSNEVTLGSENGSTGDVTVSGAGSTWNNDGNIVAGHNGDGTLNISGGGTVINNDCYIGDHYGAKGVVTVDGIGSELNNFGLIVGERGYGTLYITNGGVVNNEYGAIGFESTSTGVVTVDGAGSELNNSYGIYVGYLNNGTLNITNGGMVSNVDCFIGVWGGSIGTITVDCVGSSLQCSGTLSVGWNSNGALEIFNGGLVSVGELLIIDYDGGDGSYINMSTGGMLALFGDAADSLQEFLDLIEGSDAINFWDEDTLSWEKITSATYGVDYTLEYIDDITSDLNGYTVLTVAPISKPITIYIDVKPQSCPNPLNVKSKGVLPLAILGSEEFDVNEIDISSIEILGVRPIRSGVEDVATPLAEEAQPEDCLCSMEGPDGYLDLTLKFNMQDIVEAIGEVEDRDYVILTLTGFLANGMAIEGTDCVVILKKGKH